MLAANFKASTPEEKLEWIFRVFDKDGSGVVDLDEVISIVIGLHKVTLGRLTDMRIS